MASRSLEWFAMVECHVKLTSALASDILNISGLLFANNIISNETHAKMLLSSITAEEKASFLVGAVRSVAESSPQKFRDFIDVLSKEQMTEDVAKMLASSYERLQNRAASLVDLKISQSEEYSVVSSMFPVIVNAIAQNSLMIAEAVSKEALIPADTMDQILTVDYTPLQRAEILCKALMEEIEKDTKVFCKFLALLSNLGLNRPLIITLKNLLPSFKVEKPDEDDWGIGDANIKIFKAIKENDVEYVRYLLRLGVVDVNQYIVFDPSVDPCTVLEAACVHAHEELVKVLIEEFGADVNKVRSDSNLTPLYYACKVGNVEIVKFLLEHGAKVDMGPESGGVPPLVRVASSGYIDIIKILLDPKYGALKGSYNFHQCTPLATACGNGHLEAAKIFLEVGIPINVIADDGGFSLYLASSFGYHNIVELLLQHGAHVDLHSSECRTALMGACEFGHTKAVKILLEHGANTSLIAKNGYFALERASYGGYRAIVKLLIEHNTFVNMANKKGQTALMAASIRGKFSIVQLLLQAGADRRMNTRDGFQLQAVDFARKAGHGQIVNLLLGRPTIKESFVTLLPLAAKWKTIGFLLELDDTLLSVIDCSTNEEALRLMLLIWLASNDPKPSWEALAEAIEPLDGNIAEKISSFCN